MTLLEPSAWTGRVFSSGWRQTTGKISVTEPATGGVLGEVGQATAVDVDLAVESALLAQRTWAAASYRDRVAVLRRAADLFVEHADEIGWWATREAGWLRAAAPPQAYNAAEECHEAAALAGMPYGEVLRTSQPRLSFARQLPVGVVGVISPFNAPIALAIRSVAPALALGNAVILKPDPRTSVVGGVVFARIFEEAGLPDGLLHVLPGGADVGEAIVRHQDIPVVAFTGSTEAGRGIARSAAEHLKRVHLELGGNSALVVLEDADLDAAVAAGARGAFRHQGQICMATGRHLVHESLVDDYAEALAEHAAGLRVGDPADDEVEVGPVIDERQRDRVHSLVTATVDAGATARSGASYDGLFYRPTVLTGITTSSAAYAQEVFGPVAPVLSFRDDDEAAKLAADSSYGLALGVITQDVMRGLAIAEQVPTGLVHVNDQTINDEVTAPFGGLRASGNGARHGGHQRNLEAFTDTQWVTVRAQPPADPGAGRWTDTKRKGGAQ